MVECCSNQNIGYIFWCVCDGLGYCLERLHIDTMLQHLAEKFNAGAFAVAPFLNDRIASIRRRACLSTPWDDEDPPPGLFPAFFAFAFLPICAASDVYY